MKKLKDLKIFRGIFPVIALLMMIGCHDSVWDDVPSSISSFVAKYYPMSGISSYLEKDGQCIVTLQAGATLTFDSKYNWISVNGNGSTLPVIFVTDQLPEKLVEYLQSIQLTDAVYSATTNAKETVVKTANFKITYDKQTGEIRQGS